MISRTVAIDFGGVLSIHQESNSSGHRSTTINMPRSIDALVTNYTLIHSVVDLEQ